MIGIAIVVLMKSVTVGKKEIDLYNHDSNRFLMAKRTSLLTLQTNDH